MGLVLSSSSRSFYRLAAPPAGKKAKTDVTRKRRRKAAGAAGEQTLLQRMTSPQVVAGTAAVGLVAVFVGLVASTFSRPIPQA